MIIINIMCLILLAIYLVFNIIVATEVPVTEMKEDFIDDQRLLGKICANTFYALAWLLKGIKYLANKFIA